MIKELDELKYQKYYLNKLIEKQQKQIRNLIQHTKHLEEDKIKSIPVMDDEQRRKKAFAWNECTFHYSQHRAFLEILEQAIQERHHAYKIAEYLAGKSKTGTSFSGVMGGTAWVQQEYREGTIGVLRGYNRGTGGVQGGNSRGTGGVQ